MHVPGGFAEGGRGRWIVRSRPARVVVHSLNPSTREAVAGISLCSVLQSEFQDTQGNTEKPCLKKQNNKHPNKSFMGKETMLLFKGPNLVFTLTLESP